MLTPMASTDALVRVVVADDHPFFRDGVTRGLTMSGRVRVVAEA
jgi:two-component system, NarL family, nitrate/nitrite response regulator NarL